MRRARSDDEKRERREAILDTALGMYEADPRFDAFTMGALAERAGLAKGTLYLYFRTKEELFLGLVERLFGEWFDDVDRRAGRKGEAWTAERAADEIVASVRGRLTLARLLSIMGTIVEHNVEPGAALRYKRGVVERMAGTGARLEGRIPFLRAGEGARLLVHLHVLVTGVWMMAEPSAVIRSVLDAPEMAPARVEFEAELRFLLATLLRGMERG